MNSILTEAFKRLIIARGLVDTGFLLNSINVSTKLVGSEIYIDITGADYLPYVIVDNDLINLFQNDPLVSQEISIMLTPMIEQMVQDAINGKFTDVTPRAFVLINGV
jgi:hypothetical protein